MIARRTHGLTPSIQRLLITVCVMMATIMQVLDITIANVSLPYMQGSLSATLDQVSWVLTSLIGTQTPMRTVERRVMPSPFWNHLAPYTTRACWQSGGIEARTGLRMMPTSPRSPLSFRTAGFPQYGWKAGLSGGAFPSPDQLKPAPGMR